ncbi:MAG: MotA/TolQ/ExbB proton channel family protein [Bacteroidetes bacterium]|nr:MotA/TolQ/ExbB proton channel family protein [Bacteroidota bacterium]MBP7399678.1 MotA/TolQ/ExbB proton channel family protein [Chitinophagales bacterium]MBK7108102.1 MotA/TolQ/ExbB proton channel family protein [Bacteroidota bacterium]MBK8486463.1 MotA/TolQ/ExbB proton channel family protein [Bacteroidota bacterium]MBK8683243.1 MotA/TolQ/ExbB proton channel family protein [Bacteroidota bacterium]
MKKLIGIIALLGVFVIIPGVLMAQDAAEEVVASEGGITLMKRYFIEGGWAFMSTILVCLILGLAFCIERIITLSLADINADKLLANIEKSLVAKDVEKAKSFCKATRGPIASIMYQGLTRTDEGIDIVEKTVSSYGSVQMGQLEKGLSWISLFIALAPMLGFFGTVIGMVQAFDDIANAGAISATIVASGIKVALLTTVFGLIVAIILQVFYNFIASKIESIVNKMEDSSITFIDLLVKNKIA